MNKTTTLPVQNFEAVKAMREIRDKLNHDIMNMTFEEERAYLDMLLHKKVQQTITTSSQLPSR
ncbi:MAG: hypothetical protein JNJ85_03440 [Candidatus Kapabacteria bacterium]|nr:hypothetical protein [Candidatus Kapabacteria bacterium]